jgi:hypothetical protein
MSIDAHRARRERVLDAMLERARRCGPCAPGLSQPRPGYPYRFDSHRYLTGF